MRDEAAKEMQAAIDSMKLSLQAKQVDLATLHSPEDNELSRQQIAEVQELIADMEQRVGSHLHHGLEYIQSLTKASYSSLISESRLLM